MSPKPHHWSVDRFDRKERLLKFIVEHPGCELIEILKAMTRSLKFSPEGIRKYLSEFVETDEIENREGKYYPSGYEEQPQKQKEESKEGSGQPK